MGPGAHPGGSGVAVRPTPPLGPPSRRRVASVGSAALARMVPEWSRLEAAGFQVDVLRPWVFSPRPGEDTFWSFQLQESIRHRRPFFTVCQTGVEAWVDSHTPERAVRVLEPASFEQVWRQAEMGQAWMDLAFFPERSGLWWVDLHRRRLAWLFRLTRREGHRLCWVRLIEPARWQRGLEEGVHWGDLWEALRRWASQEAAGVWLLVGPPDVVKAWWTVRLAQWLSEMTPFPWVGVHDRWGRWDGLAEVVPTEAFPRWLEKHMDEPGGLLAEWNGMPQMFQALLLASTRKPVLVSVAHPTPLHAIYRLWHMGFASALRAGRLRGWVAVVTPRVNCGWCAEPYRMPAARAVSQVLPWAPPRGLAVPPDVPGLRPRPAPRLEGAPGRPGLRGAPVGSYRRPLGSTIPGEYDDLATRRIRVDPASPPSSVDRRPIPTGPRR